MKRIYNLLQIVLAIVCVYGQAQEQTIEYSAEKIIGTSESYEFTSEQSTEATTAYSNAATTTAFANSNEAGSTAGSLSVSMTGTANYTIPIMVPPGIKDVAPQLSLSYSSQSSNGLAGWGWDISGLSTISRVAATEYYDGFHDGIDFNNDRFALDGQRLILKSGSYGSNGSVYETENYSNIKVRAYGTSPYGGPSYFIVFYPNGARAWYGTSGSTSRLEWAIKKWQDPQRNYIQYDYSLDNGLLNIKRIIYGGHSGVTSPKNEVNFIYKTRTRPEQVYVGGYSFVRSNLLQKIYVKTGSAIYRRYELHHDKTLTLDYEVLDAVQEFNGQNKAFQPITFNYGSTFTQLYKVSNNIKLIPGVDYRTSKSFAGDFDGDGFMDVVLYNKNQRTKLSVHTKLHDKNLNLGYTINTSYFEDVFPNTTLTGNQQILGRQGITTVQETVSQTNPTSTVRFRTLALAAYGPVFQYDKTWQAPTYTAGDFQGVRKRHKISKKFLSGDFDGDGLTDVLAISRPYFYNDCQIIPNCEEGVGPPGIWKSKNNNANTSENKLPPSECLNCETFNVNTSHVNFIDLDRSKTSNFSNYAGTLASSLGHYDQLQVADFNGDGRMDIFHFKNGSVRIYTLDKNKRIKLLYTKNSSRIKLDFPIFLGDYNGDGKTDFIIPTANYSKTWAVFMSSGHQFISSTKNFSFGYYKHRVWGAYLHEYHYSAQDYNGDGKTDFMSHFVETRLDNKKFKCEIIRTFENIATGNPLTPKFKFTDEFYNYNNHDIRSYGFPIFIDLLQEDGRLEYAYVSGSNISTYELSKNHKKDVELKSIHNNSVITEIQYETLGYPDDNVQNAYSVGWGQKYPYININHAAGYRLVKKLTERSSGVVRYQDFYYKGAVTHIGQGFLGFTQTKRSNWYGNGVGKLWTISNHDPTKKGAISTQLVSNSLYSGNTYISKTTTTYQTTLSPKKVFTNIPTTVIQHNKLNNTITKKVLTYDGYKNVLSEYTTFSGGSKLITNVYSNNINANNKYYYVGRITKTNEKNTIGSNSFITEQQYLYSNNLVNQLKTRGNGTPWNSESFYYDGFGNVTKKQLNASGLAPRIEHFKYDSSGRFLMESTDIEGLKTKYTYDVFGNPKSTTNPYNQTTTFNYDGWGRLISERNFLGKYTYYTYKKLANGGLEKSINYPMGKDEVTQYNALGWMTKSSVLGLNSKWTHRYFKYDVAGRKIKESEPSLGYVVFWNTVSFDQYGREIVRRRFNGQTVNISYSGLTVTVNDEVKTVKTTKDGGGNIIKVQDPGGTITYTYHGNGTMKTANYGGNVVQTYIDNWGRKSKLIDPSAGTYTYKYNSIGEVLEETTPKGKTTYVYDPFGKVLQKKVIGSETNLNLSYTYDNTTKLLTKISGYNGRTNEHSSYIYKYDGHKRPWITIEKNSKAYFEHRNDYDGHGNIYRDIYYAKYYADNTATYVRTYNVFDSGSGELKAIKDSNTNATLWKLNSVNQRGQATNITLGNNITKKRSYFMYGLGHLSQIYDHGNNGIALHVNYSFDVKRGNLMVRDHKSMNWKETFTYDSLDRLKQVNGQKNRHQTYDSRGRITNNSNIGQYNYTGNTSYRLKNINLNSTGDAYYKTHSTQDVVYNAYKKPVAVTTKNKGRATFEYGVLQNRSHAYYGGQETDKTKRRYQKHYSAIFPAEIEIDKTTGNTKIMTYIGGDAYSAPIVHLKQTKSGQSNGFHYLHRDYLGSILAITNSSGTVLERRQFGAWGTVDKFIDHNGNTTFTHNSLLNRGYTGHEHFFEIDLIHMNGRMYDANLGRFLSPDNYIQEPFNTQSYNRYSYVVNNPLKYIDPSGELFGLIEFFGTPWGQRILGAALASAYIFLKDAQIGRWLKTNIKSIGEDIARPFREIGRFFRRLFGGKKRRRQPPPPQVETSNGGVKIDGAMRMQAHIPPAFVINSTKKGVSLDDYYAFAKGLKSGFSAGMDSSWEFIKSLGTKEGWQDLGQGMLDLVDMGSQFSPRGMMLRNNMTNSMTNYIENIPNMTPYEMGYDLGYGVEKGVEFLATRNIYTGAGIGVKNVRFLSNTTTRGTTLFKTGRNFRIDFDFRNWFHYHRRGPGGIKRHRPWQAKPGDKGNFWKRF